MNFVKKHYPLITAPVITLTILLYVFAKYSLYPFGQGTVAWCDMNQQTVPLLMNFKDILSGRESIFLNMHNAGGMNFFGVFFFFLSSPFSLLVVLAEKETMLLFADIIIILKLYTSAFTAALYFMMCKKNLGGGLTVSLSVMYALCGYGMLFYQNIMWLDMMYLFPVLMTGLEKLVKEQKSLLYTVSLTACVVMNYYISYMIAVFILIYMALYVFGKAKNSQIVCAKFLSATVSAAMMTAVIWLCCYIQTSQSGRISFTIADSKFLTSYMTVLPLLFCTAFIFPILSVHIFSSKKRSAEHNRNIILFILMLVPFFIEPVNLMWHTGNYMSFPSRFGFITVFMGLICCADFFETQIIQPAKTNKIKTLLFLTIPIGLTIFYACYSENYISQNFDTLIEYVKSLWGNKDSFDGLARLFVITAVCYTAMYVLYRKKRLTKQVFSIFVLAVCILESIGNVTVYMASPYRNNPTRTKNFQAVVQSSDALNDSEFYRVADNTGNADYNMLGAMGYNSIGHYTSLTNQNFLFTQRRLGYTTVWRKAGSLGGTELTDGLYSVKYRLAKSNNEYILQEQPLYLGLGIITDNDLSEEIPENLTRAEIQEYIFSEIFADSGKLIRKYEYSKNSKGIVYSDNKYHIANNAKIIYTIHVIGSQSLYFDCFDKISDSLSEDYFKSLKIKVNGKVTENSYPNSDKNGLLKLGTFQNETVQIEVSSAKTISCYSFGVFGLNTRTLTNAFHSAECVNLSYHGGKIYGTYTSAQENSCFLAIPFSNAFKITVNGESIAYRKALSDFVVFDLKAGENHIEIQLVPKGFATGLTITCTGIAFFALYLLFRSRIKLSAKVLKLCEILTGFVSIGCVLLIYAFPIIITIL